MSPIAFARYDLDVKSSDLVKSIREDKSVLVVPGDHFGMDGYLRFRHGLPPGYLGEGLKRVGQVISKLK